MNLLITGAWDRASNAAPLIREMGHNVVLLQQEADALPCPAEWVEGVICNALFSYHPIETFPNLRFIQLTSAGFDRVPMEQVRARGIEIHNAGDVYSIPMAEHAIACALWFYRGLGAFRDNQRAHVWEKRRDLKELKGSPVLIIGCGRVGTACAKAFKVLGCQVFGIDAEIRTDASFSEIQGIDGLEDGLKMADIVVVSLPLTQETRHVLSHRELSAMKDGTLLINISRGAVVDTAALSDHLSRLGGVALDVFEEEPLDRDDPLWDQENVLITPHNSFVGDGNSERLQAVIMGNLRKAK